MSDDEEDYMSDKFLAGQDVRPSLIGDRAKKRQVEIAEKQSDVIKRQRQERMERTGANRNERLQESLQRPIEAANKGFQLLAKMGYKPGQALGKESTQTEVKRKALVEPIGISIKSDRGGLGREAALRELAEKRRLLRQKRLQRQTDGGNVSIEEFRQRATQKADERFVQSALKRCQLTCENLDMTSEITTPEIVWFWPERLIEPNEDDKKETEGESLAAETPLEEDEYSSAEKLELLTSYLRTSYIFCFWCGVRYESQEDMDSNCPGLTRDDH